MNRILVRTNLALILSFFACDRPRVAPKIVAVPRAAVVGSTTHSIQEIEFDPSVARFVETYCLGCHGDANSAKRISLEALADEESARKSGKLWELAMENVWSESMPPLGRPRPSREEIRAVDAWLDENLPRENGSSCRGPSFRRLNRSEYNNTIRDLTGLDLKPADDFPSDDLGDGFDNNGEVLSISPLLMERFVSAAEDVVKALARDQRLWSKVLIPEPDRTPPALRDFVQPVRSEPTKRVGFGAPRLAVDPAFVEAERAYQILRAFADRAFRRPALHEELTRLLALFESSRRDGENFESAIKLPLQAILSSPAFLYVGLPPANASLGFDPRSQDAYVLASRLSYFLWSSKPDEELEVLAGRGKSLLDPKILAGQVERMLENPRSRALARNFSTQWLQLRRLDNFQPDPGSFPRSIKRSETQ